jgi:CheY-like chemotaxis protein
MHTILLVEDSEDDAFFVTRAFSMISTPCSLQITADGQHALDYLKGMNQFGNRQQFPLPEFILLDIQLPHINGWEVLEWIRRDPKLSELPVAMFTNSRDAGCVNRAYELGADAYFIKPANQEKLNGLLKSVTQTWFKCGMFPEGSADLDHRPPAIR